MGTNALIAEQIFYDKVLLPTLKTFNTLSFPKLIFTVKFKQETRTKIKT